MKYWQATDSKLGSEIYLNPTEEETLEKPTYIGRVDHKLKFLGKFSVLNRSIKDWTRVLQYCWRKTYKKQKVWEYVKYIFLGKCIILFYVFLFLIIRCF